MGAKAHLMRYKNPLMPIDQARALLSLQLSGNIKSPSELVPQMYRRTLQQVHIPRSWGSLKSLPDLTSSLAYNLTSSPYEDIVKARKLNVRMTLVGHKRIFVYKADGKRIEGNNRTVISYLADGQRMISATRLLSYGT